MKGSIDEGAYSQSILISYIMLSLGLVRPFRLWEYVCACDAA